MDPGRGRSVPLPRSARSPRTTSRRRSTPSCATSRSSGTCGSPWSGSAPSCASTSSPPTTRSGRSAATSAAGSTPRPSWRTTTSASAPTTTSRTPRATRSSSTGPSPAPAPRRRRTRTRRRACPSAKVLGGPRGRRHAFRPASVVNVSGMSFGALSGNADRGAQPRRRRWPAACTTPARARISPYHRSGGDLVFQIGTGYFGCRDANGDFDLARLRDLVASAPVRAIEIKLSQGAKPGLGGMLPGAKVSAEIAEVRGIEPGEDCASPSRHQVFADVDSMLDFVETVADATGLPGRHQVRRRQHGLLGRPGRGSMAARAAAASTSSTSTAARAAPAPRRWSSPTPWPTRSGSGSPRSTAGSRRPG